MSKAKPLDYAARCERYARQRGWAYDEHRMSIGHLTPRQRRRAMRKERRALPFYSSRAIGMPWDPRYEPPGPLVIDSYGGLDDYGCTGDPHDLGYCVTPGCGCCGDGDG